MKEIFVENLTAGMRFSKPVYLDQGENEFLPSFIEINDNDIELLKNQGFKVLYTEGEKLEKDETNIFDSLDERLNSAFDHALEQTRARNLARTNQAKKEAEKAMAVVDDTPSFSSVKNTTTYTEYILLVRKVQQVFDAIKNHERLSSAPVAKIVEQLEKLLDIHAEIFVALILEDELKEFKMAKAAIDVASLSYLASKYMQLGKDKITEITTAALLHDIGMLRVNNDILTKAEKLNDTEMQAIETHAMYGYDCLTSEFLYPQTLAKIVMQHHEWYDGTGYPSRLSENEIDIGARILACADAFVAMTSQKAYRKAMLGYEAMKALLNDNSTHFDPQVINALIRSIGIYPIGSLVLLSDGSLCRVVKSVPEFPLRPKLRLLVDANGTVYGDDENKIIDLQIQKNLFITNAVDASLVNI